MKKNEHSHIGEYEYIKFDYRREEYYNSIKEIENLNYSVQDLIEHFPCFVGHMTLSRFLGLYELYKKSLGIAGHIGEIGTYKGASLLFFAKLIRNFEHESLTQVHAFDWFKGTGKDDIESFVQEGTYKESYDRLIKLIRMQNMDNIVFVHKMDVREELEKFLNKNLHLQFKLFFFDAGMYNIVKTCLPLIWERITPGGIVIFDQYNHETSPGETMAIREILPDKIVKTIPNIWMPTAYIEK